jgi:branched-chain amino acid transport system substrate-binding protein
MKDKMTRRSFLKWSGAAFASISAAGLVGCGNLRGAGGGGNEGPIRIGHMAPRSGFLGQLGAQAAMGAEFAVDEINEAGGINGRMLELIEEDTPDPGVAVQKATALVNQNQVDVLMGEISSASGLAIADIAQRNQKLYMNTGWNSNAGRSEQCNRYTFHIDGNNSMYVGAVGLWVTENIQRKNWYFLTADYAFGHDLLNESQKLLEQQGGEAIGSDLVPTGTTDYSSYIIKIRNANPELIFLNLAGTDQTTFLKQYTAEFGAPIDVTGGVMDTVQFWAVGAQDLTGVWPATYYHQIDTPENRDFVQRWREQHNNTPPDNQAWHDYVAVKILAEAMTETGSTNSDELVEFLESGHEFNVLKERPARFRQLDHQLMYDMYAVRVKRENAEDQHDIFEILQPVPGEGQDLERIQIPEEDSQCQFEQS